jgi:curved DNA-binding protein CbpA
MDQRPSTAFDLLGLTPRPFLDPDALKAKFLKISAPLHPDRVHHLSEKEKQEATKKFAELNAAYASLSDPKERLFLLIKLKTGTAPAVIQSIPENVSDLVIEIGKICKEFDGEKEATTTRESSPLLKAMAQRKQQEWFSKLDKLKQIMKEQEQVAMEKLKEVDRLWMEVADHASLCSRLEDLGRKFSFLKKWTQQLDERLLQLKMHAFP